MRLGIPGFASIKAPLSPDDVVVILFHDHGSRYVGKVYNDDWMRDRGFLPQYSKTASDMVEKHLKKPLLTVGSGEPVVNAIAIMRKFDISQLPVVKDGKIVGLLDDSRLLRQMAPDILNRLCEEVMGPPLPIVPGHASKDEVMSALSKDHPALLVQLPAGGFHILTRHDLLSALG